MIEPRTRTAKTTSNFFLLHQHRTRMLSHALLFFVAAAVGSAPVTFEGFGSTDQDPARGRIRCRGAGADGCGALLGGCGGGSGAGSAGAAVCRAVAQALKASPLARLGYTSVDTDPAWGGLLRFSRSPPAAQAMRFAARLRAASAGGAAGHPAAPGHYGRRIAAESSEERSVGTALRANAALTNAASAAVWCRAAGGGELAGHFECRSGKEGVEDDEWFNSKGGRRPQEDHTRGGADAAASSIEWKKAEAAGGVALPRFAKRAKNKWGYMR